MSDAKTYVFGNEGSSNGMLGLIAPLLQKQGLDPNMVMAMMNNRSGFGSEGGWFIWVIFLFFLMGWGRNGWGNSSAQGDLPLANFLNNDNGRDLLMSAIQGNGTAISQLATTLNCDVNAIQTAITNVSALTSQVGNQVGLTGQQVVNAIQSGNQTLAAQIAQCCCDNKLLVTNQGYENRIANLEQTNQLGSKIDGGTSQITNAIANQTALINDRFCALELRDMQSKISQLQEEKSTLQATISNANQTNQIQGYIASVISPLAQEVNAIKAAQPQTVTLPYSCATAVPTVLAQYLYGDLLKNISTTTNA